MLSFVNNTTRIFIEFFQWFYIFHVFTLTVADELNRLLSESFCITFDEAKYTFAGLLQNSLHGYSVFHIEILFELIRSVTPTLVLN